MSEDAFLQHQKAALETELAELRALSALADGDADTVELDQSRIGRLSRMDAMQQQAMHEEQNRRRKRQTKKVLAALERIASDDYGWCQDCGEEINPKRLEISPAAAYCTNCADKHN